MTPRQQLITGPVVEPVSVDELRTHTVIDDTFDDAYLQALIIRARRRFEKNTGRLLVTQTWQCAFDQLPRLLEIPKTPVQQVVSVSLLNSDGTYTELNSSTYRVVSHGLLKQIMPMPNTNWPCLTVCAPDAVVVEFIAGHAQVTIGESSAYINESSIVDKGDYELAKQAIMILCADWYVNREDTAPVQLYPAPNAYSAICTELSVDLL
jgi:uncharacterized phiE125 gp8 family phage protein